MFRFSFCSTLWVTGVLTVVGVRAEENPSSESPTTQPNVTDNAEHYKTASYGIGYDMGQYAKSSLKIKLNDQAIIDGFKDAINGAQSRVTPDQMQAAMIALSQELNAAAEAEQKAQEQKLADNARDAESKGKTYRDENAKKPGVITTASGLQIQHLKEGTGGSPKSTSKVKVHYTGTLIDGTKFDSSVDRGQPAEFRLDEVIKGWTEGLQLMKVGGKARLVIPPELGYGARGAGRSIPPNATLIFDVELLDITQP
ncbi:MAG: peptidyl-prolyl cis-trans isomerase [Phycisphaerae bacterium]|jgi:FKBP-type peptidyl-prolyl cis-trans isomerase FkpA/FKBP-type peptidyl-prolyl cis-trans isomerase FklB|nr:MAG: peptidyl-prolyl cis-trans isomerase [Phycisphaerae bacterium]